VSEYIPIGYVARRTGLAVSAIRYYESVDLIKPVRSASGQRQFRRADIRRLSFIQIAQQMGFSIAEIRERLSSLPNSRTPNKRDWQNISKNFRKVLDQKIATLEKMRDNLDGCIGCGCLSLSRCRLYNADDTARRYGPGARFLLGDTADRDIN